MDHILEKISNCIEYGKIDKNSSYPPDMTGEDGADELTLKALKAGISPSEILQKGMITGMEKVGQKFSEHKIFVPQMLISARAMAKAMLHMKPYFRDGSVKRKGTFIIGTVFGDLHDIGKNLVVMMVEGNGWEVIDLGVDVKPEKFIEKIEEYPEGIVGLSALLTTTMINMGRVTEKIKKASPDTKIIIGGAPVNKEFSDKIGADEYGRDPQSAIAFLEKHRS
jgi:5-methyltetrahydrofolate--homocysteine methyltransferase